VSACELDQRFKIPSVEPDYFLQFSDGFFGFELGVQSLGNFMQSRDIRAIVPAA
jgi:hypothetical protein